MSNIHHIFIQFNIIAPPKKPELSEKQLQKIAQDAARPYSIRNTMIPNPLGLKDYKVPHFNNSLIGTPNVLPSAAKMSKPDLGAQLPHKQFMKTVNYENVNKHDESIA